MGWIIGIFFFFGLLFIGGIGFLIYKVIRRSTRKHTPDEEKQVVNELRQKTKEMIAGLHPWAGHSYEDLSVSMRYSYRKGIAHRMKGKVHSTQNKSVVAFNRYERGLYADGYVAAATDSFTYFFKIQRGKTFDVWRDGNKLGQITEDGNIYDADRTQIGHALHPKKASFNVGGIVQGRVGDTSFPLMMNGRKLADVVVAPDHAGIGDSALIGVNENNYGVQTLRHVDNPNEEEEKWLLGLAILETTFHGHWMI